MALSYPSDCDTPRKRTEYCYRTQELLRLIYNGMRRWCRDGLAQNQWDRFPQKIKNRYPYKPQLTKDELLDFNNNVFEPISDKISNQIGVQRQLLFESTEWEINVEDI